MVSSPSQIFLESPHIPHRTCDECAEELNMIRTALRSAFSSPNLRHSGSNPPPPIFQGASALGEYWTHQQQSFNRRRRSDESDIIRAPIRISSVDNNSNGEGSSRQILNGGSSSSAPASSKVRPHFYSPKQKYGPIIESVALGTSDDGFSGESDEDNYSRAFETKAESAGAGSSHASNTNTRHTPSSSKGSRYRHNGQGSSRRGKVAVGRNSSCPVCNRQFAREMTERDKEEHITACLKAAEFSGSPEQVHRPNRMLIYKLPESEAKALGECIICFEDFVTGELVGRLECFCAYHEKCIMAWFAKKGAGECPVHTVNE